MSNLVKLFTYLLTYLLLFAYNTERGLADRVTQTHAHTNMKEINLVNQMYSYSLAGYWYPIL